MSKSIKKGYLATVIAAVLATSISPVLAQVAPEEENSVSASSAAAKGGDALKGDDAAKGGDALKGKELEKIVVTAQRRAQSIQEVPVAVTSIGAADLELKQVTNVLDLQYEIPNISLATNTGTASGARIFLRGVGEDESRVSADPAVGVYVDGVYVGRQVGALFDLVDLRASGSVARPARDLIWAKFKWWRH
ncbi:TonB-dependent receptor plug domain-containing protein [Paraglaciecola sp. Hal342]